MGSHPGGRCPMFHLLLVRKFNWCIVCRFTLTVNCWSISISIPKWMHQNWFWILLKSIFNQIVKYNECGRTVSGRMITLKDHNDKVLKTWHFDGKSTGYVEIESNAMAWPKSAVARRQCGWKHIWVLIFLVFLHQVFHPAWRGQKGQKKIRCACPTYGGNTFEVLGSQPTQGYGLAGYGEPNELIQWASLRKCFSWQALSQLNWIDLRAPACA